MSKLDIRLAEGKQMTGIKEHCILWKWIAKGDVARLRKRDDSD